MVPHCSFEWFRKIQPVCKFHARLIFFFCLLLRAPDRRQPGPRVWPGGGEAEVLRAVAFGFWRQSHSLGHSLHPLPSHARRDVRRARGLHLRRGPARLHGAGVSRVLLEPAAARLGPARGGHHGGELRGRGGGGARHPAPPRLLSVRRQHLAEKQGTSYFYNSSQTRHIFFLLQYKIKYLS